MSVNKKHGLGRGLEALLGDDDLSFSLDNINTSDLTDSGIKTVNINDLYASNYQPRKEFNQDALDALVNSIKEKGVLQPLLVRKKDDKYEIIAGERRWRASKLAGLTEVPVKEIPRICTRVRVRPITIPATDEFSIFEVTPRIAITKTKVRMISTRIERPMLPL